MLLTARLPDHLVLRRAGLPSDEPGSTQEWASRLPSLPMQPTASTAHQPLVRTPAAPAARPAAATAAALASAQSCRALLAPAAVALLELCHSFAPSGNTSLMPPHFRCAMCCTQRSQCTLCSMTTPVKAAVSCCCLLRKQWPMQQLLRMQTVQGCYSKTSCHACTSCISLMIPAVGVHGFCNSCCVPKIDEVATIR